MSNTTNYILTKFTPNILIMRQNICTRNYFGKFCKPPLILVKKDSNIKFLVITNNRLQRFV